LSTTRTGLDHLHDLNDVAVVRVVPLVLDRGRDDGPVVVPARPADELLDDLIHGHRARAQERIDLERIVDPEPERADRKWQRRRDLAPVLGHDPGSRAKAAHLTVVLPCSLVEVRRVEHRVNHTLELIEPDARRLIVVQIVVGEFEVEPRPVRARQAGIHAAIERTKRQNGMGVHELPHLWTLPALRVHAQARHLAVAGIVGDGVPVGFAVLPLRLERLRQLVDVLAPGPLASRGARRRTA
jgi:hypothetical protein